MYHITLFKPAFMILCISNRGAISGKTEEVSKTGVTPMLLFVCKHGNATVYEWRTGKAPKDVRKEDITLDLDDKLDDVAEVCSVIFQFLLRFHPIQWRRNGLDCVDISTPVFPEVDFPLKNLGGGGGVGLIKSISIFRTG